MGIYPAIIVIFYILVSIISILLLFFVIKLRQLAAGRKRVYKELKHMPDRKLSPFGSVKRLSILPLIDFYADNDKLKTEAGVSYLIKADNTTILLDVGFNFRRKHPSPLLQNMQALGIKSQDIDMIFISHLHSDHVGGMQEQKKGIFSISQGPVELREIPVYAPGNLSPSHWNPGPQAEVVKEPRILKDGIASIGVIPRFLFIMGYTSEHSLAINVEGKGIVLIVGCGHQTIERIIARTKILFDEPIYGIIGGLHLPVKGGRIMLGPLNVQQIVGCDKPPWHGLGEEDVKSAIAAIKKENPRLIALSPHDSSDESLAQFKCAFQENYHELKVGKEICL